MKTNRIPLIFVGLIFSFFCFRTYAGNATTTIEIRPAHGREYLDLFATICDEKSWNKIKTWAQKTNFEDQEISGAAIQVQNETFKYDSNLQIKLLKDRAVLIQNGEETSGSLCDLVANLLTDDAKANSSFLYLVVPDAHAEEPVRSLVYPKHPLFNIAASAAVGCAAGAIGLVAPGCLVVGGAGAVLGTIFQIGSYVGVALSELRLSSDLSLLASSPAFKFRSCSKSLVYANSENRALSILRDAPDKLKPAAEVMATYEFRKDGKLLYRWRAIANDLFGRCKSSADAENLTKQIQSKVTVRYSRRLPATEPNSAAKSSNRNG